MTIQRWVWPLPLLALLALSPASASDLAKEVRTLREHTGWVGGVAFAPDSQLLATASADGTAILWDVKTGRAVRTFKGHTDRVVAVAFSPDGRLLATASFDGTARVWDVATGEARHTLRGHRGAVLAVAFAPDDK